jgi:hypothetical protein
MRMQSRKSSTWLLLIAVLCLLAWAGSLPSPVQAGPAPLPPRPTSEPPRTPGPRPGHAPELLVIGTAIDLHVQFAPGWRWARYPWEKLYTIVQWQDSRRIWHDVNGWQGTLDDLVDGEGRKVWWVADADLGAGLFRWLVYDRYRGKLLATSAPFRLPEASNQAVIVRVRLGAR